MPHYRESENGNRILLKVYPEDLVSVATPGGVTEIEMGAFNSLTSVAIPDSVTTIESWAFSRCSNLQVIAIAAPAPAEERETKRQSPAVAVSSVGLFSPGAVGDVLEEPSPRPAP